MVKLIKIRFTAWREQGAIPRTPSLQRQFDYWNTRVGVLSREAAEIAALRAHADNDGLRESIGRVIDELQKVEAERMLLLSAEAAERGVLTGEAREHQRAGTFGYEISDDAGVVGVVDEHGNDLPPTAVFSYEIADAPPPARGDK